jgi:hypothetical protein
MTTVHSAPIVASPAEEIGPGERMQRLRRRQRLMREQLLVVLVLLVALAATVAVLAMQWLSSAPSAGALRVPGSQPAAYSTSGGPI